MLECGGLSNCLLTYKVILFYLILLANLRWFASGVFKGSMGHMFILYNLVNTIFELSKPDMLITTMIIIREIVLCIDEDFQFDQES